MNRAARRAIAGVVLLSCGGAAAAQASGEGWLGGFLMTELSVHGLRATPLNPNNRLGISKHQMRQAAVVEGEWERVTFRAKAEAEYERDVGGVRSRIIVQELNRVFQLTDAQSLSIGKRLFSLDPTFIGQPLGFFQKEVDLTDPTDAAARSEGLPMVVWTWADASACVNVIYSDDTGAARDGFNRGLRQWAVRISREFAGSGVSGVLRKATGESIGFGGTFTATIRDDMSAYGAFYTANGTNWPALVRTGSVQVLASSREVDGRSYPRAAIGLNWTPRDRPRLQIEVMYDRRGMSAADYDRFVQAMQAHVRDLADPRLHGSAMASLAAQARALLPRGARRQYANLTAEHADGPWTVSGGVHLGLSDGSAVVFGSVGYAWARGVSFSLSGSRLTGSRQSERGLGLVETNVQARVRWTY